MSEKKHSGPVPPDENQSHPPQRGVHVLSPEERRLVDEAIRQRDSAGKSSGGTPAEKAPTGRACVGVAGDVGKERGEILAEVRRVIEKNLSSAVSFEALAVELRRNLPVVQAEKQLYESLETGLQWVAGVPQILASGNYNREQFVDLVSPHITRECGLRAKFIVLANEWFDKQAAATERASAITQPGIQAVEPARSKSWWRRILGK